MKSNFDNEFQVPIPCPKCFNKLVCIRYDPQIKLLKDRIWHLCRNCGFQRSTDEFKKELLVI